MFIVKLNSVGDTLWTKEFLQSSFDSYPYSISVIQTSDGGYMMLGNTDDTHNLILQSPLIKLNSSGDTLWTKSFIFNYGRGWMSNIRQTSDGGYIIGGCIEQDTNMKTGCFAILIKTNELGDTLWTKLYGKKAINNSFTQIYEYNMAQTNDGGNVLVGWTGNFSVGGFVVKTDLLGNSTCDAGHAIFSVMKFPFTVYSGTNIYTGSIESRIPVTIGLGSTSSIDPCLIITEINEEHKENNLLIYPNPAEDNLTVEIASSMDAIISIYNIQGQLIMNHNLKFEKTKIDISNFSKGMYFLKINSKNGITIKKFMKE